MFNMENTKKYCRNLPANLTFLHIRNNKIPFYL